MKHFQLIPLVLLVLLFSLAGCSGNSSTNPPQLSPAKLGSLHIIVNGAPVGAKVSLKVYKDGSNVTRDSIVVIKTTTLDSLEVGIYHIEISPIVTSKGDTLQPDVQKHTVQIKEGQVTEAIIKFTQVVSSNFGIKLFYAPNVTGPDAVSQGYYYDETGTTRSEWYERDSLGDLGYPSGYELDGCNLIGQEIKAAGLSTTHSVSASGSSASGSLAIQVDSAQRQVTIISSATASSSPATSADSPETGSSVARMFFMKQWTGIPSLALEIDNPQGEAIDVILEWAYTRSATANEPHPSFSVTSATGQAVCSIMRGIQFCGGNVPRAEVIFIVSASYPPEGFVGVDTLQVTGSEIIGIDLQIQATAGQNKKFFAATGAYLSGSANSSVQGSLTITVKKRQ